MKITNRDSREYVIRKEEFSTDNETIFAKKYGDRVYVVYSYGHHFPMYVYDYEHGVWIGNSDKYSRTTSKHQSITRPRNVTHWVDTTLIRHIVEEGLTRYIANRMTN